MPDDGLEGALDLPEGGRLSNSENMVRMHELWGKNGIRAATGGGADI